MSAAGPPLGPRRLPLRVAVTCLLVVVVLVVLDQWSKAAVFEWFAQEGEFPRDPHGHERYTLLGKRIAFMISLNAGAAWGFFARHPQVLVIGRILAVIVLTGILLRARFRHWLTVGAVVLVLAGAIGNLVDNLFTGGVEEGHPYRLVRDFIDVWFLWDAVGLDWHFPTFNVADSCISVGAVGFVLSGLFQRGSDAEDDDPDAAGETEGEPNRPAE